MGERDRAKFQRESVQFVRIVHPDDRVTLPVMTLAEYTSCLGARAMQIEKGSMAFTTVVQGMTPETIAQKELAEGTCPLIIRREHKDGTCEEWSLREMTLPPELALSQ